MKLKDVIVATGVAKEGMTVGDVIRECIEAGVRAIPYCDEHDRVVGLCSLKNITKRILVPEYMIETINVLDDTFEVLDDAALRAREVLDQPIEPYVYDSFWPVTSRTPLMKAVAVMERNRTDYAFVIDDQHYRGIVTVWGIASRILDISKDEG